MGDTRVKITISNVSNASGSMAVNAIVDRGATFSLFPEATLKRLGVKPENTVNLKLADGRVITRKSGWVKASINRRTNRIPVIFGRKNEPALLGVTALEILGFAVDPIKRRLVAKKYYQHYACFFFTKVARFVFNYM